MSKKERHTINLSSESYQLLQDVSKACGMTQASLVSFAVAEWESRHCKEGTVSYKKLLDIRTRASMVPITSGRVK